MDNELANDRTFLAWLRTGIALFGLGFVVAKIALIVKPNPKPLSDENLYTGVGVFIVLCGAALILVGYLQHAAIAHALERDYDRPRRWWPLTITAFAATGSVLLAILIIVST